MLQPVQEILFKSSKKPLEMEYVTDWLNKNIDQYNKIKGISQAMDLFQTNEGLIRLPMDLKGTSEDDQFLETYSNLIKIKELYDKEAYFKGELESIESIGDITKSHEKFILKNKGVYENDVFSFFIEYVSDSKEDDNITIHLNQLTSKLNIDPEAFQYMFQFSKTYEDHFKNKNYER